MSRQILVQNDRRYGGGAARAMRIRSRIAIGER
jgi:hypothetical protein